MNNICVNTKSTDFIKASQELDISKQDLEAIVHEFINDPKNYDPSKDKEIPFPSYSYIQSKLIGYNNKVSKTGYKLWQRRYSQPLIIPNRVEARIRYDEAVRYFGKDAIRMYTNSSGSKVITVAAPINPISTENTKKERQEFLDNLIDQQSRISIDMRPKLSKSKFKSAFEKEASWHYSIVLPPSGQYSSEKAAIEYIKQTISQAGAQRTAFSFGSVVTYRDINGNPVSEIYINFPSGNRSKRSIKEKSIVKEDSALRETPEDYYKSLSEDERLSQYALEEQEAREDRLWEDANDATYTIDNSVNYNTLLSQAKKLPPKLRSKVNSLLEKLQQSRDNQGDTYFEEIDKEYFNEGASTAKEVLTKISEQAIDPAVRELAKAALNSLGNAESTILSRVDVSNTNKSRRGAYFSDSQDIEIYNNAAIGSTETQARDLLERVILHEVIHAMTSKALVSDQIARDKIMPIYQEFIDAIEKNNFLKTYAVKNEREFVAEFLSQPVLREALMFIPSRDKNLSIGQKILNWIKDLLGIKSKDSLFKKADTAIQELLNSTINTTYSEQSNFVDAESSSIEEYSTPFQFYQQNYDYTLVPAEELKGALAGTNSNTKQIRVKEGVTLNELLDYISGNVKSKTSEQKAAVFKLLNDIGYTKETLKELLETQEDIEKFLVYHEYSHLFNSDTDSYWEPGEREGKVPIDYLTPKKIDIELRATLDAINRIAKEKGLDNLTIQPKKQETKEQDTFMSKQKTVSEQLDRLQSSAILSASELQHIAEQAVFWISDHITELQTKPGLAAKIYGPAHEGKDYSNESRAEVVRKIGPDNIMKRCQLQFSPVDVEGRPKYRSRKITKKAELIVDNWKAVMFLASSTMLSTEKFSITSSTDGKISEVISDINLDVDNFNESNDQSSVEENQGSLQEHWQVETKTLDVVDTLSQLVKQALIKCYKLDENGNKVTSEWGINERIDVRDATNSILRWTQGALTLDQVINKLQEKVANNPWVNQLIEKLTDNSGKEADFKSQFFSNFCKHHQLYSVVIEENGTFKSILVNLNPALSEAMTQITTQFKIGEHPLFTSSGVNKTTFNELKNAVNSLEEYRHQDKLTKSEGRTEAARLLGFIANTLGYNIPSSMVETVLSTDTFNKMWKTAERIVKSLEENLTNKEYEPFEFKSKGSIEGNVRQFLKPITDQLEDTAVSAFYDSGKMYQSYITPSYMSKLMKKFAQQGEEFDKFIQKEYGNYPWFMSTVNGKKVWRNLWLEILDNNTPIGGKTAREVLSHKVQLNFNKHNYMRNMNDIEYTLSVIAEYFSEVTSQNQGMVPAWFRIPMMSNKPSSEFIRFASFRDALYKDTITDGLKMIFDQEISRIQTVLMRNLNKKDRRFIKNFDTNGKKFNFLSFMNDYLKGGKEQNSELGKLLQKKLEKSLSTEEEATLNELVLETIYNKMEERANDIVDKWYSDGLFDGAKKIANLGKTEEEIRANLINFVWNDTLAAMNIMQLTITDTAFYKDAEDLQKRLAQIHAPGIRGDITATDYNGNPVTDGKFRTFYIKDHDGFISNIIDNVSIVFDRKIEAAPEHEKAGFRALKESLVGENGAFRYINVTDAQGYSSPSSYRKKAFMFGRWSKEAEEIYQKLKKGEATYDELNTAFQPLKPFVYGHTTKSSGVEDAPLDKLKVGVQNKNSEYLLIMADAILQGENTGRPNLLRAIFEVMEESSMGTDDKGNEIYRNDGIDTVQFDSTVKAGLTGAIDLNDFINTENGEALAKQAIMDAIYKDGQYNEETVHELSYEDYCLQQEVPEHFKNHEQAHGSQIRYIIPSELETTNYLGEPVTYKCEGRDLTAEEFKAEYENTIAENIEDSMQRLSEELNLDRFNLKDRNIALSKILQREILSSPRYGYDLLQACSVDENGQFRIPLGDPIQSKRVEQLLNSVIKNRVNKQEIAGGPVVQVTNFGTSKELSIRFKDKRGGLLLTRAEYEKNPIKREDSSIMSYEDYIKENQGGIAYFEVFAPIYSNELFSKFADKNGIINIQALEKLDPDLLKMVGYRIPTEEKYSTAPLKIVGFLPRVAGDGIMLPNDITLLTGSDKVIV